MLLCGHYEGIDERIIEEFVDEEISLGDFVLTGGEIPAMAVADCVARLLPGVLAEGSAERESHSGMLLEYPQYTRPAEIEGKKVPEILLSGKHEEIEAWQLRAAEERTKRKRPDLYDKYAEQKQKNEVFYFDNSATTRQDDRVTAGNAGSRAFPVRESLFSSPSGCGGREEAAGIPKASCRYDRREGAGALFYLLRNRKQ